MGWTFSYVRQFLVDVCIKVFLFWSHNHISVWVCACAPRADAMTKRRKMREETKNIWHFIRSHNVWRAKYSAFFFSGNGKKNNNWFLMIDTCDKQRRKGHHFDCVLKRWSDLSLFMGCIAHKSIFFLSFVLRIGCGKRCKSPRG